MEEQSSRPNPGIGDQRMSRFGRIAWVLATVGTLSAVAVRILDSSGRWGLPAGLALRVISGILALTAPVGLVLAMRILVPMLRAPVYDRRTDRAMILAAITLAGAVSAAILFPWTDRYPTERMENACMSNIHQLGTAVRLYARDHDGRLPDPGRWNDLLMPYLHNREVFVCPASPDQRQPTYAMNSRLRGLRLSDVRDPLYTVMIFESMPGRNLSGGPELVSSPARHPDDRVMAGCVGGMPICGCRFVRVDQLNWDPRAMASGHGLR